MHSVTCDTKIEIMRASQFRMSHKRSFDGHIQSLIQSIYPFLRFLATHIIYNSRCVVLLLKNVVALLRFRKRERQNHQKVSCLLPFFFSLNFLFTAGDWSWMSPCPSPDLQFEHIVFSTLLLEHLSALDLKCSFSLYLSSSA